MNFFWIAVKIWARTILINTLLVALGIFLFRELDYLGSVFFLMIAAFLVTAPLLMIITQVIRLSKMMPYELQAKISWVSFMLSLIAVIFYWLFGILLDEPFSFKKPELLFFCIATVTSILITIRISRKSFLILKT